MSINDIAFEALIPNDEQISSLYNLLNRRKHQISHNSQPSIQQHKAFVENHPYRAWYLVKNSDQTFGSFYVSNDNTIGINIVEQESVELVSLVIKFVKDTYRPLEPIASVRSGVFAINVAQSNVFLINAMRKLGSEVVQITFFV